MALHTPHRPTQLIDQIPNMLKSSTYFLRTENDLWVTSNWPSSADPSSTSARRGGPAPAWTQWIRPDRSTGRSTRTHPDRTRSSSDRCLERASGRGVGGGAQVEMGGPGREVEVQTVKNEESVNVCNSPNCSWLYPFFIFFLQSLALVTNIETL